MTEWLLIITIWTGSGTAVTTVKVPDKQSCYRAAKVATLTLPGSITTGCVEITKEIILTKEKH
jgi:hypothetical protein